MKKYSVREMLRDFKIIEFPCIITRRGTPICVMIPWEEWNRAEEATISDEASAQMEEPIGWMVEGNSERQLKEKMRSPHGRDKN